MKYFIVFIMVSSLLIGLLAGTATKEIPEMQSDFDVILQQDQ